jgi:hypothetical protein
LLDLRYHVHFRTSFQDTGGFNRYLDICAYYGEDFFAPNTEAIACWEAKTGRSRDFVQESQDRWLTRRYGFPIYYVFGVGISGHIAS